MYEQSDSKTTEEREDDFSGIRERSEQEEVETKLKTSLFGGYSKKEVKDIIDNYKESLEEMQESFLFQISRLKSENERVMDERAILKKQLNEELEKNKNFKVLEEEARQLQREKSDILNKCGELESSKQLLEQKIRELEETQGNGSEDYEDLKNQYMQLREEYRKTREDYRQLEREYEELKKTKDAAAPSKTVIRDLMQQMDSLNIYCESMERQKKSLESQLESMNTINQELSKITKEYEARKVEYQEYQKKYMRLKNENDDLNNEMETASKVLNDILSQYEEKEGENEKLRRRLSEEKQQLLSVLDDKLKMETANVDMRKQLYSAEEEAREWKVKCEDLKRELDEEVRKRIEIENSKVIKLMGNEQADSKIVEANSELASDEELENVLNQVKSVSEKLARMTEASKPANEATLPPETLKITEEDCC